jgi:hypothetical protein
MDSTNFQMLLKNINACNQAVEWSKDKDWETIFRTCHRGDWLLFLFKRTNPDDLRLLTLAKGHCAKTVIHLMKDQRSIDAVEIAIKFGNNEATREELDAAAAAAAAATAAAYAYAAYADAYAAATAAYAAAAAAATAADAYAYAAYAAYADAIERNQKETADICRKYLPIEVWNIK